MDIIKTYEDYVSQVKDKFQLLSESEISNILRYGFTMFYMYNKSNMDTYHRSPYFTAYVGNFFNDNLKFYNYWRIKYKKKLRYIYKRENRIYDGFYYFGVTEKEFQKYLAQKKHTGKRRKIFTFSRVYAYKIKEEAFADRSNKYFFKLNYPEDVGWAFYKEDWSTRRASYFAYRDKDNKIQLI